MATSVPQPARIAAIFLAALLYLMAAAPAAHAQEELLADTVDVDIPAQPLTSAMIELSRQTGIEVLMSTEMVEGFETEGVQGRMPLSEALTRLLANTDLSYSATGAKTVSIQELGNGMGRNADGAVVDEEGITQPWAGVEEIIVTGQKREERLQDVPIAISAFSADDLEAQKLEGGFDLLKAIPNVTFSKTNFTGYNFQIRGIGTQAISATTDPGVAVAFNSNGLIVNRLFEQEYVDIERVEVLRGPQGTLYGRNATGGVINVITKKPELNVFNAAIEGEIGNYDAKRIRGHINIPLIDDMLAARIAYASTERDGYDYNETTRNRINGRDLWTGRVTLGFQPTDSIRMDLLWERFEEDDNRSRTSKQLCHTDEGKQFVGDTPVVQFPGNPFNEFLEPGKTSQGCKPGSLYSEEAYGAPNGTSLPYIRANIYTFWPIGNLPSGEPVGPMKLVDPYAGLDQSRDLRTIASVRDPVYRAQADLFELSADIDVTDALTLTSQTVYNKDEVFSFQDYNRFNTQPGVFRDTTQLTPDFLSGDFSQLVPGGEFCDPQIGCSDRIVLFDISQSKSKQFSQELRLTSAFGGPVEFSFGGNYTEFETVNDYYVMSNLFTLLAIIPPLGGKQTTGDIDLTTCTRSGGIFNPDVTVPIKSPESDCIFVDPNPVDTSENFDGEGHNYFRSKNPYELESWAAFGELYYNLTDSLKLTAGLRYTKDEKTFTPVPSQLLLAPGNIAGGVVNHGYPEDPDIIQEWGEWTGRLVLDWQADLPFTDETLVYGSYSRGYKAGGANPPTPGFATPWETGEFLGLTDEEIQDRIDTETCFCATKLPVLSLNAVDYGPTFDAEFVDAFEIGTKNTLFDGAMTLNLTAFYYDYQDYQVSQIRDRTAVNQNFDAEVWGFEIETLFAPTVNLQFIANLGYLDTRIADGETSIDIMNRTQGNPDYMISKPWVQLPSNCVLPTALQEENLIERNGLLSCAGVGGLPGNIFGGNFDYSEYPELNDGNGLLAQLGGNELPNAPHWTANAGMQYGRDILSSAWRLTFRTDAYWQGDSYHRVYNLEPYDRLKSWYNFNVSVKLGNEPLGLEAEFYVKNLLDKSPITGAFLNSDDSGLTTNVFTLDPRLVGLSIRKEF